MRRLGSVILVIGSLATLAGAQGAPGRTPRTELMMVTGSEYGTYYAMARDLKRLFDEVVPDAGIGLAVVPSPGALQNVIDVFRYGAITSATPNPNGDYNNNGTVDAADYPVWRNALGQSVTLPNDSTPGTVTQADYDVWKANFGLAGGPTGPSTLINGFVRYVTSATAAAVPEPSTVLMVGIGLASLAMGGSRKRND